jgi:hypothetical protein
MPTTFADLLLKAGDLWTRIFNQTRERERDRFDRTAEYLENLADSIHEMVAALREDRRPTEKCAELHFTLGHFRSILRRGPFCQEDELKRGCPGAC